MSNIPVDAIRAHYDHLSFLYRWFWGEHIHHGFWENGESPAEAQLKLVEQLAQRAAIARGAHVLDVGCGFGGSSLWLAGKLGCSVLGITISPVQKRIAKKRARKIGVADRVQFEVRDANRLEFRPSSFDTVWVVESSEHLADKQQFVRECARLLRPRGVFALCSWLVTECSSVNRKVVDEICRGMLCPSLATMNDYTRWLAESGFERVSAEDVTRKVRKTWDICEAILRHPIARVLLPLTGSQTREFAATFTTMRRAYAGGALAYGMLTARKP